MTVSLVRYPQLSWSIHLCQILFLCVIGTVHAQESSGYTSAGWNNGASSSGAATQGSGEVLPVEFVVKLKGKQVEGQERISLEGETRVQNSRLEMYFKRKQRESQKSSYSYGNSRRNGNGYPAAATRSNGSNTSGKAGTTNAQGNFDCGSDSAAGIVHAHFKLLQLQPMAGTGKVTAEVYMGENENTPYLEALEMRLNPFKKTPMELVMSTFDEVDIRSVRVVVHLDGPVKAEWKEQEFTAEFRCYLQVGESYTGYGSGSIESGEAEMQWVEDSESSQ